MTTIEIGALIVTILVLAVVAFLVFWTGVRHAAQRDRRMMQFNRERDW